MRCKIIAVAGKPSGWVADATETYLKRLPKVWRTRIDVIAPSRQRSSTARIEEEWQRISARLTDVSHTVVLDERGDSLTSRQLADRIRGWQTDAEHVAFVIGGPDGHGRVEAGGSTALLSLSRMTLPHELARVVLVEQLYRAVTIIEGHPYHRD